MWERQIKMELNGIFYVELKLESIDRPIVAMETHEKNKHQTMIAKIYFGLFFSPSSIYVGKKKIEFSKRSFCVFCAISKVVSVTFSARMHSDLFFSVVVSYKCLMLMLCKVGVFQAELLLHLL